MNILKHLSYCRYLLLLSYLLQPGNVTANVCQEGLGIPPFLSSGAKPNLLLALDNSGSMLDTAYVNTVGECVDNGFDTTKTYAGLFDPEKWYQWTAGVPQWLSGTTYNVGDYVFTEGVFYKATAKSGGASVGANIDADTSTTWTLVYQIPKWTNGTVYPAKSFVRYDNQLYYSAAGGTANDPNTADGVTIQGDSMAWVAVDSTWLVGQSYNIGDVVSDDGMLFRATSSGSAVGTGVADDSGVSWARLDEGYFTETAYTTSDDAATALSSASGDGYKHDDLYAKILSVGGVQSGVTAFAARGSFLNWASASKFDIQKKILTGGKYNENQQSLVSEGRGCSSRGFIKEVDVTHQSSGASNVITFAIRGFNEDDWLDTTDDTSRIAILGVSTNGFIGSDRQKACQTVIDEVAKGEDANQGIIRTNVDTCLDYSGANNVLAESNAAYNHSIHTCWSIVKKGYTVPADLGNVSEITNACQNIYNNGVTPATIDPYNSGYMCFGVYNSTIPDANEPTGTGSSREGYVGRCWEPGTVPAGCEAVPCNGPYDTGNPRCMADKLTYVCSGNYNSSKDTCNKAWKLVLQDADPTDAIVCDTTASATPGLWTNDMNPNSSLECIQEAMWDYCGSLKIPEVIDPSDQIFNTGETWGMVGAMIDSGVVAMFGTDRPLLVMKGYIRQASAPEGIIQEVAADLRIGAMAFNDNGASTECDESIKNDTIEQYCPDVNRDGAKVISPIKDGLAVNAISGLQHVEELTTAINSIRATSWTPLAEAIYNALGYYGQNINLRLDEDDFKIAGEDPNFEDPVQYWCQENNILIITEGASTADINSDVAAKISALAGQGVEDPTISATNEGQCLNEAGQSDLFGSTFFDDLTYAGQNAINAGIFTTSTLPSDDGTAMEKRNIRTYMVIAGVPRDNGSADDECNPATIMENAANNGGTSLLTGEDPAQLEANLRAALSDILFRTSAGSAASVISSSRSGEGGVYQAIFWPKIARGIGKDPLVWAGDVHAFFIDEHGLLWDDYSGNSPSTKGELWTEDTDADGILDPGEDVYPLDVDGNPQPNGVLDGDRRIITYFNDATNSTQICFNPSVIDTGICAASNYYNTPAGSVELRDFDRYLWSAAVQLQTVSEISTNRSVLADSTWDFSDNRRYIFTWNDLDNDGLVDSDFDNDGSVDDDGADNIDREEVLQLVSDMNAGPLNVADAVAPRNDFFDDFNVSSTDELNRLIEWLRGNDIYETDVNSNGVLEAAEDINGNGVRDYIFRCRKYSDCDDPNALNNPTWRLGDVIHSTPTLVARPAEGYHFIYKDPEYAVFYKKYMDRRHVIYFGGNDGMLHAVNGGFYQAGKNKFVPCREDQRDASNKCISATPYSANSAEAYPALGDELWAYIPYNLQPHLSCLADPEYAHKYFVDAPPRIFDARIFPNDDIHPGGWGTILVGYMRLGGSPTLADETAPFTDNRKFISSYFILDVTDPERPPKVLAEMTMTTDEEDYNSDGTTEPKYTPMGYTTAMPTLTAMRDELGNSEWYLVFGNGPTTEKGANDQQGRVAIVPLSALTGVNWKSNPSGTYEPSTRKPFRIPNEEPTATSSVPHFGRKLIPPAGNGEVNSFSGDMVTVDFDVKNEAIPGIGVPYKSDAVYFGTVDGSDFDAATRTYWDGDGRMFRLVTRIVDINGDEQYSYPDSWYLSKLLDAQGPITAAPNLGYDKSNFWIYFGTGRFFATEDKTDTSTQYFFGVKEPFGSNCSFNWNEVDWWNDASASPKSTNPAANPGLQGLLRTDQVQVVESDPTDPGKFLGNYFYCDGCTIPLNSVNTSDVDSAHTYYKFSDLEKYIQGETCGKVADNSTIGIDGWYREFNDLRERSLGMPTLLGGLVTYTSYRPFADLCRAEGLSFLYGVYYLTGTAWYENVFGTYNDTEQKLIVKDRLDLGKGLATTPSLQTGGGPHDVNAYIQTSTGEIVKVGQDNLPLFNFKSGRTSWRTR